MSRMILSILLLFSTACTYINVNKLEEKEYPPVQANDTLLYFHDILPEKPYIIIASISVLKPGTILQLIKTLRENAAGIGADAVINVQVTMKHGGFLDKIRISGNAIRFVQ